MGDDTGDPWLIAAIRDEIRTAGPVTFARFMERALYEPGHGYYAAGDGRPGREGDFLTAPEATPLFGRTLARQVLACWRALREPPAFTLREYAAGSGALAGPLLAELREEDPAAFAALRYEAFEPSVPRQMELSERLAAEGLADRLVAPPSAAFEGMVLANELLDAFPVHRVTLARGRLREIGVGWRDGRFADELLQPSTPELGAYLRRVGASLAEGQVTEVNLGIRRWLAEVAGALTRGWVVVIDYGMPALELHAPARPRGTLKAARGHRVGNDPYRNVGRQDLTAHVDLTELELAARDAGFDVLRTTTQGPYLAALGLGELLVAAQAREHSVSAGIATRSAVKWLLDPRATGGFAVTILGRGVDAVPEPPALAR